MNSLPNSFTRAGALLAINLLFLMVWGFSAFDKVLHGMPKYFADKFAKTVLAVFPGITTSFWLVALMELMGFSLAMLALWRGEFVGRRPLVWLPAMLVGSLFVFLQLSFGLWLTADYSGTAQQFMYFGVTLVALQFVVATGRGHGEQAK